VTDVAHVFDFNAAIGRIGGFNRSGTSETSEVWPSFRALKGFRRHWEKKLVVFMADNASRGYYSNKERKVCSWFAQRHASFCYDACEAQPGQFFIELIALTRFEERGYQIWGRAEWSETLSAALFLGRLVDAVQKAL
jgi:hypothetical protein